VGLVRLSTGSVEQSTMEEAVRLVLAERQPSILLTRDSFDAARLLLVPALLGEGQELAVLVPVRGGNVLAPLTAAGVWDERVAVGRAMGRALCEKANTGSQQPLSPVPLRVSRTRMVEQL